MIRNQKGIATGFAAVALVLAWAAQPAAAGPVVDIYDGNGLDFSPLNTFFTGVGATVNQLSTSFTSVAGAQFVIISEPGFASNLTAGQLTALDNYVDAGGHLLINSEYITYCCVAETNTILTSLGSSIVNASTSSVTNYHDTTDIVSNPFTAGVSDVNYGDTSSLSGGTALVYGDPATDLGQEFIAYQAIGAGYVFVIADSDTADNINSTSTNNNGTLYCDFGGLTSCSASTSTAPEPASLLLAGAGLIDVAALKLRRA
jgi:hypothetical protein